MSSPFDDPLGLVSGATAKTSSPKNASLSAITSNPAQVTETLSTVDFSKVKLKEAKVKTVEAPKAEEPVENKDRFGLGVDLFGNLGSGQKKAVESIFTSLTTEDTSGNKGLFSDSTDTTHLNPPPLSINPHATKFRVAYEKDDMNIKDLKISGILEQEELDFGLFGKASGSLRSGFEGREKLEKGSASLTTAPREEFDLNLSDDYLKSLDAAATSTKDLSVRPEHVATPSYEYRQPAAIVEPTIDLSNMDLNAYIAQQSSPQKQGGLFD